MEQENILPCLQNLILSQFQQFRTLTNILPIFSLNKLCQGNGKPVRTNSWFP